MLAFTKRDPRQRHHAGIEISIEWALPPDNIDSISTPQLFEAGNFYDEPNQIS